MSNPFDKKSRPLTAQQEAFSKAIKAAAAELLAVYNGALLIGADGREMALARTHLEDSVMRAIRGVEA